MKLYKYTLSLFLVEILMTNSCTSKKDNEVKSNDSEVEIENEENHLSNDRKKSDVPIQKFGYEDFNNSKKPIKSYGFLLPEDANYPRPDVINDEKKILENASLKRFEDTLKIKNLSFINNVDSAFWYQGITNSNQYIILLEDNSFEFTNHNIFIVDSSGNEFIVSENSRVLVEFENGILGACFLKNKPGKLNGGVSLYQKKGLKTKEIFTKSFEGKVPIDIAFFNDSTIILSFRMDDTGETANTYDLIQIN